jgi:predicted AAA+ superfamily ATPase
VEQEEVDFVVKQGNRISELIQVCTDATGSLTRHREVRALIKAGNELNCKNLNGPDRKRGTGRNHRMVRCSGNYQVPASLEMASRIAGKNP